MSGTGKFYFLGSVVIRTLGGPNRTCSCTGYFKPLERFKNEAILINFKGFN